MTPNARLASLVGWMWIPVIVLAFARLLNLGADTPTDFVHLERDRGLYVDEGYKTLAARNLCLFGETQWNADDEYQGWWKSSPITQRAFLASFSILGQSLESARIVSVLWFMLFLITFAVGFQGKSPPAVLWGGLLLFGLEFTLFVFSRVAIFDMATVCLMYGTLLVLKRFVGNRAIAALVLFGVGVVSIFGVKENAAYLLVPALFGLLASFGLRRWSEGRFVLVCIGIGILVFLPVALVKLGVALPFGLSAPVSKADLFPVTLVIERFLSTSLFVADPWMVVLAHSCALGLLLYHFNGFAGSPYRCAIFSVVFLGTGILACLGTGPLRYAIILLPAYLLLAVEWWSEQQSPDGNERTEAVQWPRLARVAAFSVLVLLCFDLLYLAGLQLVRFGLVGDLRRWTVIAILPAAALLALAVWRLRRAILTERTLRIFVLLALVAFVTSNGYKLGRELLNPSWKVRTISRELERLLPEDAIVAGDWSPLFALGTPYRVLYTTSRQNTPEHLVALQASHFLYCETEFPDGDDGMKVKQAFERLPNVSLGPPLFESEYTGLKIALYPIQYNTSNDGNSSRGE